MRKILILPLIAIAIYVFAIGFSIYTKEYTNIGYIIGCIFWCGAYAIEMSSHMDTKERAEQLSEWIRQSQIEEEI